MYFRLGRSVVKYSSMGRRNSTVNSCNVRRRIWLLRIASEHTWRKRRTHHTTNTTQLMNVIFRRNKHLISTEKERESEREREKRYSNDSQLIKESEFLTMILERFFFLLDSKKGLYLVLISSLYSSPTFTLYSLPLFLITDSFLFPPHNSVLC